MKMEKQPPFYWTTELYDTEGGGKHMCSRQEVAT